MPHQVFISYSHADNELMGNGVSGWVTYFHDMLKSATKRQEGGEHIEFWMDPLLELQHDVNAELQARVRQSSAILALVSPRYLRSKWCLDELTNFVREVGAGKAANRVFIVELLPTERGAWPPAIGNLAALKFWEKSTDRPEPKTLGWPLPNALNDTDYWDKVNALATRLARQLDGLSPVNNAASTPPPAPIPAPAPSAPATPPADGPVNILITTDTGDEPLAIHAQDLLAELEADAFINLPPAANESPAEHRANFEDRLHESHGVIVVYGQAPRHWVQSKFGDIKKVLALHRKGTWASLLEGPPETKAHHGLPPRNLMVLDCKQGMSKAELQRFVQALRSGANHV